MTPVKWGVLGASKFALNYMAPAIHAAEGAEFVASHIIQVTEASIDDFAGGSDPQMNRKILGLD